MIKINLKEMPDTVVHCPTEDEAKELLQIYEDAGWKCAYGLNPTHSSKWYYSQYSQDTCYKITDKFEYKNTAYFRDHCYKIITLKEFIQRQGIGVTMSEYQVPEPIYKVGNVLINECGDRRKVLGICGEIYILSRHDQFKVANSAIYTAHDLHTFGYKLDTEKPKIKKTKQEIAEKFGIDVDELEIVEKDME